MARILFVVPPLTGHVNPTVSVGRALAARGHQVAWAAHPGAVGPLLPTDAELLPMPEHVDADHAAAIGTVVEHVVSAQWNRLGPTPSSRPWIAISSPGITSAR